MNKMTFEARYDCDASIVKFEVDLEKFTPAMARQLLNYLGCLLNSDGDPVIECLTKYAAECIRYGASVNTGILGVIDSFDSIAGWYPIDGSRGIELIRFERMEIHEADLDIKINRFTNTVE